MPEVTTTDKTTTPKVRTSERDAFVTCKQRWWWAYVERIRPLPSLEMGALRFGTLIHMAMETRYPVGKVRGPHPAEAFVELYAKQSEDLFKFGFRDEDGKWEEAGQLGVDMLENFVDTYGDDERYEVLATEHRFSYPIKQNGRTVFRYVGTMDGIWRDLASKYGDTLVHDWKTATSIDPRYLPMDEQAGAYLLYGVNSLVLDGLLTRKQIPKRMLYTFMRKAMRDQRQRNEAGHYLNKDGSVSLKQPSPYFHRETVYRDPADQGMMHMRVLQQFAEMSMLRSGALPHYKSPGKMRCGGCPFAEMCELHEVGGDYLAVRDTTMVSWDPYAPREIDNDEKK